MFNKREKDQFKIYNRRTFLLFGAKISIFSIIGWRFFDIQILNSKKYKTLSKKNQINVDILYPIRGEIKDRNKIIIASNKRVYDLYIIPEQTNDLEDTLNNLNDFIKINFKQKRKIINLSKKIKKFESIKVLENLDWKSLELIETNKTHLNGLHLKEDFQRLYPGNNYFAHILGYISQPDKKEVNLPYISKMPKLDIGKTGIEKFFNEDLIGTAGKKEIEVNSYGRVIREISISPSQKGKNIEISIDSRLQKFTFGELQKHKAGSIVVLDIDSGEILSMVSTPSFDPNLIIKKPNIEYWKSLLENPLSPLTFRAIQGLYSPGSTFKMIVALAALKYNLISPTATTFCEGKIEYGDRFYHCWKTKGHGRMNLEAALKESCDVYFYELSKKIGIDKMSTVAYDLGLGQTYNIGLENEKNGIIPSKKWKKENLNENWYAGETLNAAIGQGYSLSTPLQLAVMIARFASNGKKVTPTLIKRKQKINFDQIEYITKYNKIIESALFKVVNEQKGTAFKSRSSEYHFSGKTGTSQVKKITQAEKNDGGAGCSVIWVVD